MADKNIILTHEEINQKIKRIAFEIWENNFKEKEVLLAGIEGQGYVLAELIADALQKVSTLKIKLIKVSLDKLAPTQSDISINCDTADLRNKTIVLVDDVLNTGRTLAYSMKPFLQVKVKKLEVAVLVNRSHTQFPVSSNYTGYELATTINEHVEVVLGNTNREVYLK
jgi:pyrimidine operon attenuation protein / uracil phosphoribosyltransferase